MAAGDGESAFFKGFLKVSHALKGVGGKYDQNIWQVLRFGLLPCIIMLYSVPEGLDLE